MIKAVMLPLLEVQNCKIKQRNEKKKKKKVSMSVDTRIFSGICKSQMTIEFLILKWEMFQYLGQSPLWTGCSHN